MKRRQEAAEAAEREKREREAAEAAAAAHDAVDRAGSPDQPPPGEPPHDVWSRQPVHLARQIVNVGFSVTKYYQNQKHRVNIFQINTSITNCK